MKDEVRLSQMKKELDALKVELGVSTNEYNTIRKDLKEEFGVKNLKEVESLIESLEKTLTNLNKTKDGLFNSIEEKLQAYRRK